MGESHLEAPIRIQVIEEYLKQSELQTKFVISRKANQKEIESVHSTSLFNAVEHSSHQASTIFTLDTIANSHTYEAALTAAGGALQVAEHITDRSYQFGMLRPPGHHSTFDAAMGFCFFNNIAIASQYLLNNKFKRIAIIDVDHHHGNGTQDLFYMFPDVLYTSLHADPNVAFPGTGFPNEIGMGEGLGKTVNIPLPIHTADEEFLVGFDEVITPIVEQFKPEAIMVSLGLDALKDDPYGVLALTPGGYFEIGKRIGSLASRLCKKRVGVMLEGGYKYEEIGLATERFFYGLENYNLDSIITPEIHYRFDQVLREVKSIHRNHWFDL